MIYLIGRFLLRNREDELPWILLMENWGSIHRKTAAVHCSGCAIALFKAVPNFCESDSSQVRGGLPAVQRGEH